MKPTLIMVPPQCLKLIILRITMMPMLIQTTQPASIRLPSLLGEQQR